jgi:trigger factor
MRPSMATQVEEISNDKVRLTVDVPAHDVQHAVEHAASDLAESTKIPGFRKGKVPMPVLLSRIGKERLYTEAVESHIGGWFRNAALRERIQPVEQPEYGYELPASSDADWQFTATVAVQPKPDVADWTELEVPAPEPEVPEDLVEHELNVLRSTVAELAPVERPAAIGDTVLVDLISSDGEAQRDYVAEVGAGRLVPEIEEAMLGMAAGQEQTVEFEHPDGDNRTVQIVVKDVKEKILPPVDDELARAASEFDSIEDLRADIQKRLHEQLTEEIETAFRAAAADALVEASKVDAAGMLVEARARELLVGLQRTLQRRGIALETYLALSNLSPQELQDRLLAEAQQSVARELVLEAVADRLELQVPDEEVEQLVREQAEAVEDDPEQALAALRESGAFEQLRADLRLRAALDRVASEVKRIPVELAAAREKLWTPEKEKPETSAKLWTPGSKEQRQ